jgi:WD repeat-containing protein 26
VRVLVLVRVRVRVLVLVLVEHLCPSALAPEKRLRTLLQQARQYQLSQCLYHNITATEPFSLLHDHSCDRYVVVCLSIVACVACTNHLTIATACISSLIPSICVQTLEMHDDEVWHVQFSHSGTMLASASRDSTAAIWSVEGGVCSIDAGRAGRLRCACD